jgi:multicomponent Na+:H+ antiporter subunit G
MKALLIDALLVATAGAGWFGVTGFARLRTPLDRIHCVTFVNLVAGAALAAAAFTSDGVSNRSLTVLFIVALNLLAGAAMSHAMGRVFLQRGTPE